MSTPFARSNLSLVLPSRAVCRRFPFFLQATFTSSRNQSFFCSGKVLSVFCYQVSRPAGLHIPKGRNLPSCTHLSRRTWLITAGRLLFLPSRVDPATSLSRRTGGGASHRNDPGNSRPTFASRAWIPCPEGRITSVTYLQPFKEPLLLPKQLRKSGSGRLAKRNLSAPVSAGSQFS